MVEFKNENGTICSKTEKYYNSIKKYAKRYKLKNTKIALDLAIMLHQDQFRDGGAPYIIHPLEATNYLILLGIWSPIFKRNWILLMMSHLQKSLHIKIWIFF